MRSILDSKQTAESVLYSFDFSSRLAPGETLSGTPLASISVWSGTDPTPSTILGTPVISRGTLVNIVLTGGVAGVLYSLLINPSTTAGQNLYMTGILAVTSQLP